MNKPCNTQSHVSRRKAMGVHYTPPLLARFVADRLVAYVRQSGCGSFRILDPACGNGALLEALLTSFLDAGRLPSCELVGVEADELAVRETEARLEKFEFFSNLPATTSLKKLVTVAKSRWIIEQSYQQMKGELVERPFKHVLDDDGMGRTHLKGREKVAKRYLIQTAAFNVGLIMQEVTGFGTPKGWADGQGGLLLHLAGRLWAAWGRQRLLSGVLRLITAPEPTSTSRALAA